MLVIRLTIINSLYQEEHAAAHDKLRQLKWDRIENFTVFATKFLELANIAGVTESQKINMFLQSLPPAFTNNIKNTIRYQQTFNSEIQPTLKQIIDLAEQRSDVFRYVAYLRFSRILGFVRLWHAQSPTIYGFEHSCACLTLLAGK